MIYIGFTACQAQQFGVSKILLGNEYFYSTIKLIKSYIIRQLYCYKIFQIITVLLTF